MPVTITANVQNQNLLGVAKEIVNAGTADAKSLGKLVSTLGDGWASGMLDQLQNGRLPADQLVTAARKVIKANPQAGTDLTALLGDSAFVGVLDAKSKNFLEAVAGTAALTGADSFTIGGGPTSISTAGMGAASTASAVDAIDTSDPAIQEARAAVATMRDWVKSGKLQKFYAAAIDQGDASLKDEAMRVFNALPKIAPGVDATDFLRFGMWDALPKGIDQMANSARYLPGRQIKVKTNVKSDLSSYRDFMTYDKNGPVGITCRGTLVGEQGDKYLVQVEGKDDPIEVSKKEIHELNHPHSYSSSCNYDDPFTKAKICEAALEMADIVGRIDFTKMHADGGGVRGLMGRMTGHGKTVDLQKKCWGIVHDTIQIVYSDGGSSARQPGRVSATSTNAGRAAVKGKGVCTQQRQVMRDLAYPFNEILGFDMRSISGGVHRNTDRSGSMEQQLSSMQYGHDWLEVTFRPSMEMCVCDRTWRDKHISLFEAYGPNGDRYPTRSSGDSTMVKLKDSDENMSGDVTVDNYDKQFGDAATGGRTRHMTATGNVDDWGGAN